MSVPLPTIPGYEVERVLGAGGMAAVYLATHARLRRKVAIKVMANTLSLDEKFRQRFLNEAQLCAQLSHPHIINVFDSGEVDGALFMVTEFMDGGTLKERIAQGIPPADALAITEKLAEALEEAHDSRIWHRDIKPDNVLFDRRGRFVLADFGIAKSEGMDHALTGTGNIVGTPHYMSPEQFQAMPVDGRSDIYSLGIMLFQMLTGALPFDAGDLIALAMLHVKEPIPRLPAELAAYQPLVDRMLAKNPDDRFQTCTELRSAIREHVAMNGSGVLRGPAADLQRGPASVPSAPKPDVAAPRTPHPPAPAAVPPAAKSRAPLFAGLALVAVGGVGAWLWTQRTPEPAPVEPAPTPVTTPQTGASSDVPPTVAATPPREPPPEPAPTTTPAEPAPTSAPVPARVGAPRARATVDAATLGALDDAALDARLSDALRAGRWAEWESMLAALPASRHPVARHRVLFARLQDAGVSLDGSAAPAAAARSAVLKGLARDAQRAAAAGRNGRPDAAAGESAVDLYRAMLALDAGDATARAGLAQLVEQWLDAGAKAVEKGNTSAARRVYGLALRRDPENSDLKAKLDALP